MVWRDGCVCRRHCSAAWAAVGEFRLSRHHLVAEGDSHLHDVYCIGEPWCGHVVFALASQISKGHGAVPAVRRGVLRLCRHELFRLLRSDADVIGA